MEERVNCQPSFERRKISKLNKFFMRNFVLSLIFSFVLFMLTVGLLIFTIIAADVNDSLKISIISMIATFVLTTSKTIIDRVIDVATFTIKLLGEEQRGLNKKMGVEMNEIDFESLSDDKDD